MFVLALGELEGEEVAHLGSPPMGLHTSKGQPAWVDPRLGPHGPDSQ